MFLSEESDDEVTQTVTKEDTSSDVEMEDFSSEDDELADDSVNNLEKNQIGKPWIDSAGQNCRWISQKEFTDGMNKFFTSVLIDKRLFSIGDTVFAYSPTGTDSYIGKVICLYQVCFFIFK